jgi:hypothetical protein
MPHRLIVTLVPMLCLVVVLILSSRNHNATAQSSTPTITPSNSTVTATATSSPTTTATPPPTATATLPSAAELLTNAVRATVKRGSVHAKLYEHLLAPALAELVEKGRFDVSWRHYREHAILTERETRLDQNPPVTKKVTVELVISGMRAAQRRDHQTWQCENAKTVGQIHPFQLPRIRHAVNLGLSMIEGVVVWHIRGTTPAGTTPSQQLSIHVYITQSNDTVRRITEAGTVQSEGHRIRITETIDLTKYSEHVTTRLPALCKGHADITVNGSQWLWSTTPTHLAINSLFHR